MKTPLYHRIYLDILKQIESKLLTPGDTLPTEAEMERIYGTSRAPVRQALAKLESEAFIERKQGKGTFVADRNKAKHWLHFGGFGLHFTRDFENIYCKTLEIKKVPSDQRIRKNLLLSSNSKVLYISRIRYLQDDPVFFLEHFADTAFGEKVFREAGDFFLSVDYSKGSWVYI